MRLFGRHAVSCLAAHEHHSRTLARRNGCCFVARTHQQADSLEAMTRFPQMLEAQRQKVNDIISEEAGLRARLREAREAAEKDATNINTLKDLFLDCLVRSAVPG